MSEGCSARGRALALDDVASAGAGDVHQIGALQLLDKIGKAGPAVGALVERGIELQHGGLQQSQLRLHAAAFEHLQSALDQRHGLHQIERRGTLAAPSAVALLTIALLLAVTLRLTIATLRPIAARALLVNRTNFQRGHAGRHRGIGQQRFKADELVAILLENRRGKRLAADHEHRLAVFLELVHQRDEVAIAADDGEGVHMRVREGHLQSVEREVNVGSVLIAARRGNSLDHLHGVFGHLPGSAILAPPVGISEFGDDVAALLERIQRERDVKFPPQRGFQSNLDVVVIDKHRDIQFFLHSYSCTR